MSSTAIALFMYLGNTLDLPQAIELLALFDQIKRPIQEIANLRNKYSDVYLAMARIQNYLNLPEFPFHQLIQSNPSSSKYDIEINN